MLKLGWKVAFLTVNASFPLKIIDFRGEKIENHHMGDYRHMDMFFRTECHPQTDSARLQIEKITFKCSYWGEKLLF